MGVQGLVKLVDESNILEEFTLTNSHIVIDAPNVYYFLYFNSDPQLDQSHGGDYSGFKDEVCRFFQVLQDCKVTPHVVLDGGSDDEKLKTLKSRLQNKLNLAKKVAQRISGSNILPPLVKDVFKQILTERNIQFEESFGEADPWIVSWANELGCPVLSRDSDFYVYDLKEGVLPLDHFQWKNTEDGQIPAKRYRLSEFCKCFNIVTALMPVFASLAGNDYSRLEDNGKFIKFYRPTEQSGDWKINRLRALLKFLSVKMKKSLIPEESQGQAIAEALTFVRGSTSDAELFLESIKTYNIQPVRGGGDYLPDWMQKPVRDGKITSFVTDVLLHRRMMLTPLVEDFSQPSSYSAALKIRQIFYGLLIGEDKCTEFNRADANSVPEKQIPALLPSVSPDERQQLQLWRLNEAPEALRRHVLLETLNSESIMLENIPDHMKLPVCATNFWWKYRQEEHRKDTDLQYLHALLLGFVYGENLHPNCDFEKTMKGLEVKGKEIQLQPDVAHAFSQWQCCFRQSLHLNQLLCFPLPEPECSRLYCGPLLHQLAAEPESQLRTVEQLMDEEQRRLFDRLQGACHSEEHEGGRRGKHKTDTESEGNKKKIKV